MQCIRTPPWPAASSVIEPKVARWRMTQCRAKVYVPIEKRRQAEAEQSAVQSDERKTAPQPSSTCDDELEEEPAPIDDHDR
jgi:hypothetical protein